MIISPARQAPGFEGLAGRTGRPPPTRGNWCCRQPGHGQDGIEDTHTFVSLGNPCLYRPSKGEILFPEESPFPRPPSPLQGPAGLAWASPCSPGSHPELTVAPWGWAPYFPSSAIGAEFGCHHLSGFGFVSGKKGGSHQNLFPEMTLIAILGILVFWSKAGRAKRGCGNAPARTSC